MKPNRLEAVEPLANFVMGLAEPESRILDIGCGNGTLLAALRAGHRRNLTGFTSDPGQLKMLTHVWSDISEACDLHIGQLEELLKEAPPRSFGTVIVRDGAVCPKSVIRVAHDTVVVVGLAFEPYLESGLVLAATCDLPDGTTAFAGLVTMAMRKVVTEPSLEINETK